MTTVESHQKLAEWRVVEQRGRKKVLRAYKDPTTRDRLLSEIPAPTSVILHISDTDRTSALARLPAFLVDSPAYPGQPGQVMGYRYSFLGTFPPEIRNMIYRYAVGYPTCRSLFDAYYSQKQRFTTQVQRWQLITGSTRLSHFAKIKLRTPTILLLCKQITREALAVLYLQPFIFDRLPPWLMGNSSPLSLVNFISRSTLQTLRFVQIKISLGDNTAFRSGSVWLRLLSDVLKVWSERNSLVRLQIMFKLSNVTKPNVWYYELEDYEKLVDAFSHFEFYHGLKSDLIRWEHWVLDFDYAFRVGTRNPLVRKHPDRYIWQGSVLEWL
ncbi:hypothetical protein F4677DRAFT_444238 [Hypoxylon crocopeplum]|nr:hypothetical protein F4677DRAFT_444238 [Hypoxylon crocopeplum]